MKMQKKLVACGLTIILTALLVSTATMTRGNVGKHAMRWSNSCSQNLAMRWSNKSPDNLAMRWSNKFPQNLAMRWSNSLERI